MSPGWLNNEKVKEISFPAYCLLCCYGRHYCLFFGIGHWLQAGALIVLVGDPARAVYSADLYNQGYADSVNISRPVRERGKKTLEDYGIFIPKAEDIYKQILVKKRSARGQHTFFRQGLGKHR